ncbi:hypothetical protein KBJ98_02940 [Flavobacterium sp. F-328]|uniref:Lipoprotein n=1 Tax=Flavobacterium erciyesense TaxID=2825842 RepID=A0ABS5D0X3_9FLAO|nr:hypothetical protein [Flavobacterium erciyesense]MBQ0907655.1 hypothetical protein [Flavobacterium erciyesense]
MKHIKKVALLIPFFILSCNSSKYLTTYEPINVFLETQKIDKSKVHILQSDKEENRQALRIFNGGEGAERYIDPTDPTDYTDGLYVKKHWKKLYKQYVNDTIKRHWKKEDFPNYNFILEKGTGLMLTRIVIDKYAGTGIREWFTISEPMYYFNRKYILFLFETKHSARSRSSNLVIMKKEKNQWQVVRVMRDYIYN